MTDGAAETAVAMLLTTRRAPIYGLGIAKCGCTWLKNLFWLVDHGRPHPDPLNIHRTQDVDLVRPSGVTADEVAQSGMAFALVRDPADRLASLYFDKAIGPRAFPWLRARLLDRGAPPDPGVDPGLHAQAFDVLLREVAASAAGAPGALTLNPHWRPQAARLRRAAPLGLRLLPLPLATARISTMLAPAIPDIDALLAVVPARNASRRAIPAAALLTPTMRARIDAIYPRDRDLYDSALRAETAP
jgi:hypothetical protein